MKWGLLMDEEALKEIWEEFCFHLSDNIDSNIRENIFEQKVLLTLEKLLGWSQFRGEIKLKPSLRIGRQGFIIPDIVIYSSDRAAIVFEIKRPYEDLNGPGSLGQLQSYMRQTKADFGVLIGNEIHVYYDGITNPQTDPLLLLRIPFKTDSPERIIFVELFNRNSFSIGEYEKYLKSHFDRLEQERKVNALREELQSNETCHKLLNLLRNEFRNAESQILNEAMEDIKINVSFQSVEDKKNVPTSMGKLNEPQDNIYVCKNKSSGKYFIHIKDMKDNNIHFVNPDGRLITLDADLFEQQKEESINYLLSYGLITKLQLDKYREYESEQSDVRGYTSPPRTKRLRPTYKDASRKKQSPSAYDWSRGISELSDISGRVTWRAICDYLNVEVGVDPARRVLKEWARVNRPDWREIPEP